MTPSNLPAQPAPLDFPITSNCVSQNRRLNSVGPWGTFPALRNAIWHSLLVGCTVIATAAWTESAHSSEPANRTSAKQASSDRATNKPLATAKTGTGTAADEQQIPTALVDYVSKKDASYAWAHVGSQKGNGGTVHELALTSQTWQGIVWKHNLFLHEPLVLRHPEHVLLWVNGGSNGKRPSDRSLAPAMILANLCGARVATIHQIPNQPLFDNRKEDDLITETWLKYLKTGDETWPLLFPMVKGAVKTMDAVGEFCEREQKQKIRGYVITGASKRGWTSWLTPAADKRIIGTAPMVIDVLNFRKQMKHQIDTWGKYSEQIDDYSRKGLIKEGDESPREKRLREMMDPYGYRARVAIPKLLVMGTNDRYWTVDATNLYWDDLPGSKHLLFIPNAGHNLRGGELKVLSTIAVFFRHLVQDKKLPQLNWKHEDEGNVMVLTATSSVPATEVVLWKAESKSLDFRDSTWTQKVLPQPDDGTAGLTRSYRAEVSAPPSNGGHVAFFCELRYTLDGVPFSFCTQLRRK